MVMARSDLVPVFVDTSLDTHLAIAVSPHDTVASVKRKFVSEHGLCFPEVGQINIEALIAQWQGKDYHLSETLSISVVLQMEGGCFLKALVATQLRPHTDTDKQQVVCFASPTEVVNTSLKKKKKKKRMRNIVSFEDTTTVRPTQSRKVGEEEFQGHGENQPSNDCYCDAEKGESTKTKTNDVAVCEQKYIKEAPLPLCLEKEKNIFGKKSRHDFESSLEIPVSEACLEKEKDIIGKNSRHDSESPELIKDKPQVEDRNQVSLSHKEKAEKLGEKDTWSGSHEGENTKNKRKGDEKDTMPSCHECNPKEAAINEMAAEVQLELEVSSTGSNVFLCKELLPPCKKNLLVIDINGILVDITSNYKYQQYADFEISGKLGFKRPFCVDFLKFCFTNFEVGVWSSRKQHKLEEAVHHLFGEMKNKLLFCWDQSKCTDTKFKTVENKPLFFKELNKLWEKVEADLPWKNGRFTPSNTLLVDDSPCKALCNPPYTSIFPYPYTFNNKVDNSLGRGGEIRIYLEKIAVVENIPGFVKENPIGQSAITSHQHPHWNYYCDIFKALKRLGLAF
ncbi:uncharacterized protein LOC144554866 isoform X2 [Carex rostrata]